MMFSWIDFRIGNAIFAVDLEVFLLVGAGAWSSSSLTRSIDTGFFLGVDRGVAVGENAAAVCWVATRVGEAVGFGVAFVERFGLALCVGPLE